VTVNVRPTGTIEVPADPAESQNIVKNFIPYFGIGCYYSGVNQVTFEKGF
jgi:hypothetical protein